TSPITGGISIFNANARLQAATKRGFHQPKSEQSGTPLSLTKVLFCAIFFLRTLKRTGLENGVLRPRNWP
ncbi:hypothetical protein KJ781_00125, partial [Patescibacteria group bacterium]|nr:hypothetical protein [Patescibacteria group bacterium]MBU1448428.1 hypothetical protein [Patescibacteria group bacterium]